MQTVWRTLMISLDVRWRGASASRRLNCKNAAVEQARVGYMDRNRDWRIPAGAGAQSADCLGPALPSTTHCQEDGFGGRQMDRRSSRHTISGPAHLQASAKLSALSTPVAAEAVALGTTRTGSGAAKMQGACAAERRSQTPLVRRWVLIGTHVAMSRTRFAKSQQIRESLRRRLQRKPPSLHPEAAPEG